MKVLLCLTFLSLLSFGDNECKRNKIRLWSPVKCTAGKTFFVKSASLDQMGILQPYHFPWLAEIIIELPGMIKYCSGALINDKYILTSQTCVLPFTPPEHVTINLGFFNGFKNDLSEKFQKRTLQRRAIQIILQPHFDPRNPQLLGNNLALIKVDTPVIYSKTIYPIQLPYSGNQFLDYSNRLAENAEWSYCCGAQAQKTFKANNVKILSPQECSQFNGNPDVMCAVNGDGLAPCGEEGGPLSLETVRPTGNTNVLLGITAWDPFGKSCNNGHFPRVYVRIDHNLPWIKQSTRDASYCQY